MSPTVLIPLASGFEEIEAVTMIDLMRRAEIDVRVAGLAPGAIEGAHGLRIEPDLTLSDALASGAVYDMIALPGGWPGSDHLRNDLRLLGALKDHSRRGKYVAAICAAPIALAEAGLLSGRRATSYPGFVEKMGGVRFAQDPVVIDGNIVTSRGPGTAMDFSLTLIELLKGRAVRDELEAGLMRP